MKILHINLVYLPAYRYGGPIFSVHNLNKWLVKRGAEVTVYTTTIDGPDDLDVPRGTPVNLDGVSVYYFRPVSFLRRWFYSRDLHSFLAAHIKEFDLVHVTAVFTAASVLVWYYARKYKKPYIISPRGSLMNEPLAMKKRFLKKIYLRLIEWRPLRDASAVHFTAAKEKDEYIAHRFPLRREIVLPNGLDPDVESPDQVRRSLRDKFEIPQEKKIILFLSRLNWKKGLDTLIPAFAAVHQEDPDTILVLAGGDDEGYGAWIRSQITNHGLQIGVDVIFTGMLVHSKSVSFKESSVFVLPSYSENFGMAVVEAMHAGLPVVVTDGVAIAPSILKAGAGIVVKKDVGEVSQALLRVLKDPAGARAMGERGRCLVDEEFLMPAIAEKFKDEYQKLISQHA